METLGLNKRTNTRNAYILICLLSSLLTAGIICFMFYVLGLAPFGGRALIFNDGQMQMVDLFCWYKDVLTGKASIDYSFAKSLGGNNIAVFSYYLASPLSLLIVFFDKSQACLFMDVLYLLKTMLAALFAAFYLVKRFRPKGNMRYGATIMMATSYALCQYFIAQSSNNMWLDGAYMLPLILLGCEKLAAGKKSTMFIITSALAICFNWYTGIIDIMFSGIWFVFEMVRRSFSGITDGEDKDQVSTGVVFGAKDVFLSLLRFALAGICAVMISAAVLLPTLIKLAGRTHGSSGGLAMLKDLSMIGSVTTALTNYTFGYVSMKGSVSLFTGAFVLIGVILLFAAGSKALKEKLVYGCLLLFTIMMFYWQPLVAVFSIFRDVEAFWYRYSYLGCFVLIYLAAVFYLECDMSKVKTWMPLGAAAGFSCIVFLLSRLMSPGTADYFFTGVLQDLTGRLIDYETVPRIAKMIFPMLVGMAMSLVFLARKEKKEIRYVFSGILAFAICMELFAGQFILGKGYSPEDVDYISTYTEKATALLSSVTDESFYRISQTTTHSKYATLPSSYNEPMAYGYNSVTSFVSDPQEKTLFFLDRAGYPQYSETISVTASENLALDSLLGVKYVMLDASDSDRTGLDYVFGSVGFKTLYSNPYALPISFVYEGTGSYDSDKTRPAEYLNDMYRKLSGLDIDIFTPITFEENRDENVLTYTIDMGADFDSSNSIVYGNIVMDKELEAVLKNNGDEYFVYNRFMAPTFFRVATLGGKATVTLTFDTKNETYKELEVKDAQFFALNLQALKETTDTIKGRAASSIEISDGKCRFEVAQAANGEMLFTSIPTENGWTVTRNGKKVDVYLVGDALMTIPLEEGANVIEMHFTVPGKWAGIAATMLGLAMLGATIAGERILIKKKKQQSESAAQ